MIQIKINGQLHNIPEGWHEVKLTDFIPVFMAEDWFYALTRVDVEVVGPLLPVDQQKQLAAALTALAAFPNGTAETIELGKMPFETYVKISFAVQAKNVVAMAQAIYPEVTGTVADSFYQYLAVVKAWQAYQDRVKWIDEIFFIGSGKVNTTKLKKYGIYNMVFELANGNILLEDNILALQTEQVFTHWALKTEKAAILHNAQAKR
jgi:hypothetical protein